MLIRFYIFIKDTQHVWKLHQMLLKYHKLNKAGYLNINMSISSRVFLISVSAINYLLETLPLSTSHISLLQWSHITNHQVLLILLLKLENLHIFYSQHCCQFLALVLNHHAPQSAPSPHVIPPTLPFHGFPRSSG